MQSVPPAASRRTAFGLAFVALSTLMYEVLLTRIFSVTMWYHFAFVAISVAMFGMTVGALVVYLKPAWFPPDGVRRQLAVGSVLVADGDPVSALSELRAAAEAFQSLRMPYEAARTAELIGLACGALGDRTDESLELDNARAAFERLGARPDLERLARLAATSDAAGDDVLSAREREVLVHLAAGETNREIAAALVISVKTAGVHVSHILRKLDAPNRVEAAAIANRLLPPHGGRRELES